MIQNRSFDQAALRKSFSSSLSRVEIPYLSSLQKDSYEKFLQLGVNPKDRENIGIQSVFNSFFPVVDSAEKVTIEFLEYSLGKPKYTTQECLSAGRSFAAPLNAQLRMVLWSEIEGSETKEIRSIKEQEVYLCDIPLMTATSSFIINGAERVIVSQMRRAPGVFFDSEISKSNDSKSYTAKIIPHLGSWLDFEFDSKDVMYFRVDKKRKIPVSSLLRSIGLSSQDIINDFYSQTVIKLTENGWAIDFDPEYFNNKKLPYDLICSKTGEIFAKEGSKLNRKKLEEIKAKNVDSYILTQDVIPGYIIAQDLMDSETGELLLEAGAIITPESLEILQKLNFKEVSISNPSKSNVGPYLYNTILLDKNTTQKEALYDIYKAVKLGESPSSIEIAQSYFESLFFLPSRYHLSDVGRMKMNHRLGLNIDSDILCLTHEDIKKTISILSETKHCDLGTDDIDNLTNRRVRAVGELIENQMRIGMSRVEKSIIEKMNSSEIDSVMPQNLINSKPLITAIKDFFATSQLSQFMDQTNPLSEVTHKRRLSALGPGGLTRERAGFEVRDVHATHYGRICPIETPEGPNIGLINSLATYARVNEYGFIETPYATVVGGVLTNEVIYLSALQEVDTVIAPSDVTIDKNGKITDELVRCRKNGEYILIAPDGVTHADVSKKQIVSIATTLIPFLENDDANRALMGANMQRQAVPLLRPEAPVVGTGIEAIIASDSGAVIKSEFDGVVKYVDASKIVIQSENKKGLPDARIYSLVKYVRTNQDTCINQRPIVKLGQKIKAGQILTDGHSVDNGELALGKNVRVAFMPWNGYNFEDSIVISERLVHDDTFTSIHVEELEIVARDTRLGPEDITRDIPNVNEDVLAKLDEEGIIHIGAEVRPGDLLVGKTTPKSESPVTPEEKLLRVIFGEKASDVKDSSLYAPTGIHGTVVDVKVFSRKGIEKDERSIYIEMQQIEKLKKEKDMRIGFLDLAAKETLIKLFDGKKISNDISSIKAGTILKAQDLDALSKNLIVKIVVKDDKAMNEAESLISSYKSQIEDIEKEFNDSVVRIKSGDDLGQGVLHIVKVSIASKYKLQPGDKMAGRHGNKGVVSKIAALEDMPYSEDGEPVDIVLNPLGVPSRMNIGQILETHLGSASKNLGKQIKAILERVSVEKSQIVKDLRAKLARIYTLPSEKEYVDSLSEDQLIEFAHKLKKGVPFATGTFEGIEESEISNLLKESGVQESGQITLYDGKTGRKFDRPVTVGYIYMLKLHHLVDDKIHARSIGPYSLITQQPLGGKSHFGGQRFGEMECWALQAYGAAYTLQEMLTVKSDDVVGRIKIYESIIQGNQNFNCSIPESFNVMIKEVRSLGLNIELIEEQK